MFDYKTVSILEIAQRLGLQEAKRTSKSVFFHCFNQHKKACKSLEIFHDNGFVCHDCGIKGNSIELIKLKNSLSLESAIDWIKSEFDVEGKETFTLQKAKTDFNKLHCRIIAKVEHDKRFWFLDPEKLTECDYNIDSINDILGKRYSQKTFDLLKEKGIMSVRKDKYENKYLCFNTDKNKNIVLTNPEAVYTFVVEGRTDFVSVVELYKDEFQDFNFVSRYNKTSDIPLLSGEIMFLLDADEEVEDSDKEKGLVSKVKNFVSPVKGFYVKFPEKDLSDYFAKFGAKETKEYIQNNYVWFLDLEKAKESITEQKNVEPTPQNQSHSTFISSLEFSKDNLVPFFNEFLGFDRASGKYWVNFKDGGWTILPEKAVYSLLANYVIYVKDKDTGKEKEVPAFRLWLKSPEKRIISRLVFQREPAKYSEINLFIGYNFDPIKGDISVFKEYMLNVVCNKDKEKLRFLEWFIACTFQFIKVPYYLTLKGEQGAGKSFLAVAIAKILGDYAIVAQDIGILTQQFNGHLLNKNFIYLEEAFFGGDTKTNDKLKSMVTSKKMTFEMKHSGHRFEADIFFNMIVTTNHDTPTKVERDDRRTMIFSVSEERINDKAYFKNLDNWLKNGGYSLLLDYFLSLEVSEWEDFSGLDGEEKKEQKLNSMDSVERFWFDLLSDNLVYTEYYKAINDEGQMVQKEYSEVISGQIEAGKVFDTYLRYCKKTNIKPNSQTLFGTRTKKMFNLEAKRIGIKKVTNYVLDQDTMILALNKYFKQDIIPLTTQSLPFTENKDEVPF